MQDAFELKIGDDKIEMGLGQSTASALSFQFGGLYHAFERVKALDVHGMVMIVMVGAKDQALESEELRRRIYDAGIGKLAGPLADYLTRLLNGGRPPEDATA